MAKREQTNPIQEILAGYDPKKPETVEAIKGQVEKSLKLYFLSMNRVQEDFVRCKNKFGRTPRIRLFEGGNQCLTADTLVETYFGEKTVGELFRWGKPFPVYSWDGDKSVVMTALPPFRKGTPEKCYRVTMKYGRWIKTSPDHLLLCDDQKYRTVSSLAATFAPPQASVAFLRESILGRDLKVHASGVVHLSQTVSDWLDRYYPDQSLCDGPLRQGADTGPTSSPSLADALKRKELLSLQRDGRENRYASIRPWSLRDHLSNQDDYYRFGGHFAEFLGRVCGKLSQWFLGEPLSSQKLSTAEGAQLRSFAGCSEGQIPSGSAASSLKSPEYANHIVSIEVIPAQEVFDFSVPGYRNYYAAGLINHNSGKTTLGIAEDLAHMMGFRPWLKSTDPDYRIRIKVPNVGMVGCEVAGQNLIQRIEPQFKEFIAPYCEPEWTRYSDGSVKSLTLHYDYNGNKCGSTAHFRSYVQDADSFEGVLSDWQHWDEPPPQSIMNAAQRGKMASNAPSWLTMTPLKEPYIYDLYSLNAFNNDGEDQEIAIFRCSVWENCQDYCRECNVEVPENHPDRLEPGQARPVNKCPTCGKVLGFMPKAGIENYLKTITDVDEREAREEGKWKHLSGMVYKELDRQVHVYKDFPIPRDWMRIECVDPHDARPTRWLFGAVSPEEILINGQRANRIYWYTYLLASGNIDAIVRSVKVKRAEHDYKDPAMVILDAKFGARTRQTADDTSSWEEELEKVGIKHIRLSHSRPGDIALGHKMVKQYLQSQYSALKGSFPGMMWAEQGCRGDRGPIQDCWNYRWKEGSDTPEEDFKDFADCVRYAAIEQPVYKAPQLDDALVVNKEEPYNPLYFGLNLR